MGDWSDKLDYEYREYYGHLNEPDREEETEEETDEMSNEGTWIPVKWHEITDEERKHECYPREWLYLIDCKMPYDGQQILTTTKGGFVELDECYYDGVAYSLDSGRDWVDDVIAWQPLPEPYKPEKGGEE